MMEYPKLSLIVAKSRNNIIGIDGNLPWHLSSDLKFFKEKTYGKPVLMGRVTWESLPFPLPGRPNLVLTHNKAYKDSRAEIFTNLDDMIGRGYELAGQLDINEVMIIGGAKLYAETLSLCDRLYITDVDVELDGDAIFPALDMSNWQLASELPHAKGSKDDYSFIIRTYNRTQ